MTNFEVRTDFEDPKNVFKTAVIAKHFNFGPIRINTGHSGETADFPVRGHGTEPSRG